MTSLVGPVCAQYRDTPININKIPIWFSLADFACTLGFLTALHGFHDDVPLAEGVPWLPSEE